MIETTYLKNVEDYISTFSSFPIPVFICDLSFGIQWGNKEGERFLAEKIVSNEFYKVLSKLRSEFVIKSLREKGYYKFDGLLPGLEKRLILAPVYRESSIVGFLLIVYDRDVADSLTDSDSPNFEELSRATNDVMKNARDVLQNMFVTVDNLMVKTNLLKATGITQELSKVNFDSYRLLRLINNTENMYELGVQTVIPEFALIDINSWLEEIEPGVIGIIKGLDIKFTLDLSDELILLNADRKWFQVAFFNVLHNSIYYTKKDNEITVATKKTPDGVIISIKDKGLGTPEKEKKKLFVSTYSKGYKGQLPLGGLGLTIVKEVMRLHKGRVEIDSVDGEGTEVRLYFPSNYFTKTISFSQTNYDENILQNKFSPLYIGLTSAAATPYAGLE